jgi:hypothetical protein
VKRWRQNKRKEFRQKLGGKCCKCGSIENLEFDHIDPKTKELEIAQALVRWSLDKVLKELKKCQLLCRKCHRKKTGVSKHGSLRRYIYHKCRCDICVKRHREKRREYMRRHRAKKKSRRL